MGRRFMDVLTNLTKEPQKVPDTWQVTNKYTSEVEKWPPRNTDPQR
jgi:hypothetical protein